MSATFPTLMRSHVGDEEADMHFPVPAKHTGFFSYPMPVINSRHSEETVNGFAANERSSEDTVMLESPPLASLCKEHLSPIPTGSECPEGSNVNAEEASEQIEPELKATFVDPQSDSARDQLSSLVSKQHRFTHQFESVQQERIANQGELKQAQLEITECFKTNHRLKCECTFLRHALQTQIASLAATERELRNVNAAHQIVLQQNFVQARRLRSLDRQCPHHELRRQLFELEDEVDLLQEQIRRQVTHQSAQIANLEREREQETDALRQTETELYTCHEKLRSAECALKDQGKSMEAMKQSERDLQQEVDRYKRWWQALAKSS